MRLLPRGIEARLRLSGALLLVGLLVQLATQFWVHPLSFVSFVFPGAFCVVVGAIVFLTTVLRESERGGGTAP